LFFRGANPDWDKFFFFKKGKKEKKQVAHRGKGAQFVTSFNLPPV
jgi:hypothetical protein